MLGRKRDLDFVGKIDEKEGMRVGIGMGLLCSKRSESKRVGSMLEGTKVDGRDSNPRVPEGESKMSRGKIGDGWRSSVYIQQDEDSI